MILLIIALLVLGFSALYLYHYMGPDFWSYDPYRPEEDIWETD